MVTMLWQNHSHSVVTVSPSQCCDSLTVTVLWQSHSHGEVTVSQSRCCDSLTFTVLWQSHSHSVETVSQSQCCDSVTVRVLWVSQSQCCDSLSHSVVTVTVLWQSHARATLDKQSCVITSTLFEMNSTCMRWCDLNFSCLSTTITSPEVSSCQNKQRYPNPIWPTVFTFRVFKHSFCEFMTMVSLHVHKST